MTWVDMLCKSITDLAQSNAPVDQQIASAAAARFLGYASGGWLDILAWEVYRLVRDQATKTSFTLTLASLTTAPPYTFEVGDVPGGGGRPVDQYVSTTAGDLEPGGEVRDRLPGAGVRLGLRRRSERPGRHAAAGYGLRGRLDLDRRWRLHGSGEHRRIDRDPDAGPHGAGRGANAAQLFAEDRNRRRSGGSDLFTLCRRRGVRLRGTAQRLERATRRHDRERGAWDLPVVPGWRRLRVRDPGSPDYVQGDDAETDAALAQRCRYRWSSLALNVLDAKAILWAVTAYPSINRASVNPSMVTPGQWDHHGRRFAWWDRCRAGLGVIESYAKARLGVNEGMSAAAATDAPGNGRGKRARAAGYIGAGHRGDPGSGSGGVGSLPRIRPDRAVADIHF